MKKLIESGKTMSMWLAILFIVCLATKVNAQSKPTIGVIAIEGAAVGMSNTQASDLVRIELEKLNKFIVVDKYELISAAKTLNQDPENCLARTCVVKVGKEAHAQQMLTGTFNKFEDKVVISLKTINVETGEIAQSQTEEFLNLVPQIQEMVNVTLHKMFSMPVDETMYKKLTNADDYASTVNKPGQTRLKLNGPRMGVSAMTGTLAQRFSAPRSEGGYNEAPFTFIFGYQQEVQYLNSGKYQALFEFIPAVTGIDKGLFIPTFSFMNGLRNNKNGWEFALGPNFTFSKVAEGYYDKEGKWQLADPSTPADKIVTSIDSRGDVRLRPAFIFAVGKSFKSGKMNIPLNAFVIPSSGGTRFGLTFGFNAEKL